MHWGTAILCGVCTEVEQCDVQCKRYIMMMILIYCIVFHHLTAGHTATAKATSSSFNQQGGIANKITTSIQIYNSKQNNNSNQNIQQQ